MTSRRVFVSCVFASALSFAILPGAGQPANALTAPEGYVQNVAGKIVSTINSGGSATAFQGLVSKYADVRTIAKFSLGKYRKRLPANQAGEYYTLTKGHIAKLLKANTKSFRNAKLQIVSSQPKGKSTVIVRSKVVYAGGGSLPVNWRVIKRGGGYKIFDVTVKGVSMAMTLRSSFTSHISKNGGKVSALIAHLRN
ncbi:MAG: ABC transporter substrate-binding protein [Pseudomonadota bacterium]